MDYYVITFNSTNDALKAEKLVSECGGTIIPVPSEISADCGFAIRLSEFEQALNILKNKASFSEIYGVTGKGSAKVIEKIDYRLI